MPRRWRERVVSPLLSRQTCTFPHKPFAPSSQICITVPQDIGGAALEKAYGRNLHLFLLTLCHRVVVPMTGKQVTRQHHTGNHQSSRNGKRNAESHSPYANPEPDEEIGASPQSIRRSRRRIFEGRLMSAADNSFDKMGDSISCYSPSKKERQ